MKKIRPDERKIRRYQRELKHFDSAAYRRAFYRTGEQLKNRSQKGSQS